MGHWHFGFYQSSASHPARRRLAGEPTANLVKITHTTAAGLSSHPCKPSPYTGQVWRGRCRRRISMLGFYRARKAATSHMADPAHGGHEPISSRPAYSAFSLIKTTISRCQHGFIIHQPELGIPLVVQAYRSTRPRKLGLGQRQCVGSWTGMECSWRSLAELCRAVLDLL